MDRAPGPADGPASPPIEPRQRWRLVLRRVPGAPPLPQREGAAAFEAALVASGLPLVPSGRSRSRILFAAPLPASMPGEREPADLFLAERRPVHVVRERLVASLPPGYELVDLHDVWLGEPALAGQVAGADYRVSLRAGTDPQPVARAAADLLAARELPRSRVKGGETVAYDLRPLVIAVSVEAPAGPDAGASAPVPVLRVRTCIHPERGSGRPEEVVAALEERVGAPLAVSEIVRERVLLVGES